MKSNPSTFSVCLQRGIVKGWRGFLWMLKIVLPVSFGTFLLEFSGLLGSMDGFLEPLMGILHLPANAALPLIAGLLTGIYGAIAAMSVLPFTIDQMTLIAVFLLIAHSLIQEGLVQHHSGGNAWMATVVRLTAAVVTVVCLGWFLEPETAYRSGTSAAAVTAAFWPAMQAWMGAMAVLGGKILVIITGLMILMEFLRRYRLIDRVQTGIRPFLGLLGLDAQVGMLWLTAAVFGITYGGAVIVEEVAEREIDPPRLKRLHVSIGINHAMIEDPALFLPLGIHPFWLWVPRLLVAVLFTHLCRIWLWAGRRRRFPDGTTLSVGGR